MSVSPTVLLITLALGVPLMLLALGVLYHAYIFSQQPFDALEEHVDSLATESAEDLLFTLQEAVDEMQEQLAAQREALAGMLSERAQPAFATVAPLAIDPATYGATHNATYGATYGTAYEDARGEAAPRPAAAGEFVPRAHQDAMTASPSSVRAQIARLAEQGMSDRAIARELHIGLEEVRIARMMGRHS